MSRICMAGIETEYGLTGTSIVRGSQNELAHAFIEASVPAGSARWDPLEEEPMHDARGPGRPDRVRRSWTSEDGHMLINGARLYIDHGHPEYCTPECATPLDLLASDKAGETILNQCREKYEEFLPVEASISLFKNNSDHKGNAYGCHENYLVSASLYKRLFSKDSDALLNCLVTFLISRIVVCGSGKAGSENGQPAADFQISQRADFIEALVGLETMSNRPLVNTRDEPHADPAQYRRLHVIPGDANMADTSAFLKTGTMLILIGMMEDEDAVLPRLTLGQPLAALAAFSRDPACRVAARVEGAGGMTAVELQMRFAEYARAWLDRAGGEPWMTEVVRLWCEVLESLRRNPDDLSDSIDWVIKKTFLEEWGRKHNLAWTDPRMAELDIRYHDIHPQKGIFRILDRGGRVKRLVSDAMVAEAIEQPPGVTRARLRWQLMKDREGQIASATWSALTTRAGQRISLPLEPGLPVA